MLNILIHVFKKGRVLSHLSWQNFFFSPICSVCQGRDASSNTHILSQSLVELAKMEQFKNKLVSPSMKHKHTHTHPRCVSTFKYVYEHTTTHTLTHLFKVHWVNVSLVFRLSPFSSAFSSQTAPPSGLLSPCPWTGPAVWHASCEHIKTRWRRTLEWINSQSLAQLISMMTERCSYLRLSWSFFRGM